MKTKYIHNKENDDRIEYFIRNNYKCELHCNNVCPFSRAHYHNEYDCYMDEQTVNEYIQEVLQ